MKPPTSVPIGLFANAPFPTVRLTLGVGESLLLYTDGVTEAVDATGREYGRDRLVAAAGHGQRFGVKEMVSHCVGDVERYRAANRQPDDLTLFVLRRRA